MKDYVPFVEKKCPICGRTFIPAPMHIFRIDGKTFCRWTCYKKYQDAKVDKRRKENRKDEH